MDEDIKDEGLGKVVRIDDLMSWTIKQTST